MSVSHGYLRMLNTSATSSKNWNNDDDDNELGCMLKLIATCLISGVVHLEWLTELEFES